MRYSFKMKAGMFAACRNPKENAMQSRSNLRTLALLLAASVAVSACASKAPKQLPPEPGPATTTTTEPASQGPIPGSHADFLATTRGQDTIFFDIDRYDIDSDDAAALRTQAQWLARYPSKRATIEGHADERGTREYNLALGERRANAAKNFLLSQGIDGARLTTVSFGKERPLVLGSDEASWSRNRRAVTVTID